MEFYQQEVRRLETALEGINSLESPTAGGVWLLLSQELQDTRRLQKAMGSACDHLQSLFSTHSAGNSDADISTSTPLAEHDSAIGADAELPYMSDDEYSDDELDEGVEGEGKDIVEGLEEEVLVR